MTANNAGKTKAEAQAQPHKRMETGHSLSVTKKGRQNTYQPKQVSQNA